MREHRADRTRRLYGWREHTYSWHPFRDTRALRDHLWSKGGKPIFPEGLFQEGYDVWRDSYFHNYREPSHHVHSSGYALFHNYDPSTGQVVDTRRWDHMPLQLAYHLLANSLRAYADGIGALRMLNQAVIAFAA